MMYSGPFPFPAAMPIYEYIAEDPEKSCRI